ncbi:hypothetical protein [Gracilibacillus thailandensis]|nr:hypothetical protein [Gracilibacillus thailandensis]
MTQLERDAYRNIIKALTIKLYVAGLVIFGLICAVVSVWLGQ